MLGGEELAFRGPYTWIGPKEGSIFGCGWINEPGVYLWTVWTGSAFAVYFVGETGRSFGDRFLEHTRAYLSGEYIVWEPAELVQKRKVEVWGGLWKPERRGMMADFIADYDALSPKIAELLRTYHIFVAPMRGSERLRERVEAAIIRSVRISEAHPLIDENLRFRPRQPSENPVTVEFSWPHPIEGVPTRCQV